MLTERQAAKLIDYPHTHGRQVWCSDLGGDALYDINNYNSTIRETDSCRDLHAGKGSVVLLVVEWAWCDMGWKWFIWEVLCSHACA